MIPDSTEQESSQALLHSRYLITTYITPYSVMQGTPRTEAIGLYSAPTNCHQKRWSIGKRLYISKSAQSEVAMGEQFYAHWPHRFRHTASFHIGSVQPTC